MKFINVIKSALFLGRTVGQGAFGRVVKAEAFGINDFEISTIVAVKMLKGKSLLFVLFHMLILLNSHSSAPAKYVNIIVVIIISPAIISLLMDYNTNGL